MCGCVWASHVYFCIACARCTQGGGGAEKNEAWANGRVTLCSEMNYVAQKKRHGFVAGIITFCPLNLPRNNMDVRAHTKTLNHSSMSLPCLLRFLEIRLPHGFAFFLEDIGLHGM
jgi:hypothetical protein